MANIPNKEKDEKKEAQDVLLTAEEYARRERLKTKERINRVTRVAGVFAILLIAFEAILDPLFEFTYFGWIWDQIMGTDVFNSIWGHTENGLWIPGFMDRLDIFDDFLQMNAWIAQLGITILYIATIVVLAYFITYCIVDLIELVRSMYVAGRDITRDLLGNVKYTVKDSNGIDKVVIQKKPRKKSLFHGDDVEPAEKPQKEKKERVPKKKDTGTFVNEEYSGLSTSQLDDLLSGKNLEDIMNVNNDLPSPTEEIGIKKL